MLYSFFLVIPLQLNFVPTFRNTLFHLHRWFKQLQPLPRSTGTIVCVCVCVCACVNARWRPANLLFTTKRTTHRHRGAQIPGLRPPKANTFYTLAPNVCGSSVWILLHIALPEPKILRWLVDLWKMCAFLYTDIVQRSRWPDYGEGEHYNWTVHTGAMT